jgi:hypothetical protein
MKLRAWFLILTLVAFVGTGFGKDTPDLTKNSSITISSPGDMVTNVSIAEIAVTYEYAINDTFQSLTLLNQTIDVGYISGNSFYEKPTQVNYVTGKSNWQAYKSKTEFYNKYNLLFYPERSRTA